MEHFTLIELVTGITSLILGILAICLSLYHKREADKINGTTITSLAQIKTISETTIPELIEYGKSMRRYVFREEKKNGKYETENLSEIIEESVMNKTADINKKIEEISNSMEFSNSNNENTIKLDKLRNQIENLKSFVDTSEINMKKEIKNIASDIIIDMENLNGKTKKFTIGYFKTFSSLINMLYDEYLQDFVPGWTYGKNWYLKNTVTGEIIKKEMQHDTRSLEIAGIRPGDTLELVIDTELNT